MFDLPYLLWDNSSATWWIPNTCLAVGSLSVFAVTILLVETTINAFTCLSSQSYKMGLVDQRKNSVRSINTMIAPLKVCFVF